MVSVVCDYASMTDTRLTRKAEISCDLSLVVLFRAKGLSLQQGFVVLSLKFFDRHDFVSLECNPHNFMRAQTVGAHKSRAIKAIMNIRAFFLTVATSYATSIATLSNGKETQQTVVEKTSRQTVETISFGQIDLGLTLWTTELSLSVAGSCMILQTLKTKCV